MVVRLCQSVRKRLCGCAKKSSGVSQSGAAPCLQRVGEHQHARSQVQHANTKQQRTQHMQDMPSVAPAVCSVAAPQHASSQLQHAKTIQCNTCNNCQVPHLQCVTTAI
jgi:hypothetical protein